MRESRLLNLGSDPDFYALALEEYLTSCADAYSSLLSAVSDAALQESWDDDDDAGEVTSRILTEHGISPEATVLIQGGYVRAEDLLAALVGNAKTDDPTALNEVSIPAVTSDGSISQVVSSVVDIGDQLKANYQSALINAAGIAASVHSDVSQRMADFECRVKQRLTGIDGTLDSNVSYARSLLLSVGSPVDYVQNLVDTGVGQADDPTSNITFMDNDLTAITGANPAIVADFSTVKNAASTIYKAGAAVVGGIFRGALDVGKRIFSKAKQIVVDTVVDPEVLIPLDGGSGKGMIDGFQCQYDGDIVIAMPGNLVTRGLLPIQKYLNKWVMMKTIAGENLIRITKAVKSGTNELTVTGQFLTRHRMLNQVKLRPILGYGSNVKSEFQIHPTTNEIDDKIQSFADKLQGIMDDGDIYLDKTASNEEYAYGLLSAVSVNAQILYAGSLEVMSAVSEFYPDMSIYIPGWQGTPMAAMDLWGAMGAVTNDTVARLACGARTTISTDYTFGHMANNPGGPWISMVRLLMCQAIDREDNPFDWFFIPYSNANVGFSAPDFKVKTDGEVAATFTTFILAAIAAVIVVAVGGAVMMKLKKVRRAKLFKRQTENGVLDNKMWNGTPLTPKEQKRYLKNKRRIENSKLLDFSSADSSTPTASNDSAGATNDSLLTYLSKTLTGHTPVDQDGL